MSTISIICDNFDDFSEDTPQNITAKFNNFSKIAPQRVTAEFDDFSKNAPQRVTAEFDDFCEDEPQSPAPSVGTDKPKDKKSGKNDIKIKQINLDQVKEQINDNIVSIVSLIDEKRLANKDYEVSELEFNLAIHGESKVSLFSAFSAGFSAHSGITVRIKKKIMPPFKAEVQ